MEIISLFSGAGGLDLGFEKQGFRVVFANDIDKDVWETYEKNHGLAIDRRSIKEISSEEIPDAAGIIGGPPCQSWSLAGAMRGINDPRGALFYEYVRIIRDKQPLFFVAENVAGMLSSTHIGEFSKIVKEFSRLGYSISYKLLDAKNFGIPQERKRVVIVGYSHALDRTFSFPQTDMKKKTLKEAIGDLPESTPAKEGNKPNENLKITNHEHMIGTFSTIYMSRNRRKSWDGQSFTIQAGGRHAPLHPSSPEMIRRGADDWKFKDPTRKIRRLSVRECARIQTFPDRFKFYYDNVAKGYKMIGNAVPVKLGEAIAKKIKQDLKIAILNEERNDYGINHSRRLVRVVNLHAGD